MAVVVYLRHHHCIRLERLKKFTTNLVQEGRARLIPVTSRNYRVEDFPRILAVIGPFALLIEVATY
jgi:hypothetical protein